MYSIIARFLLSAIAVVAGDVLPRTRRLCFGFIAVCSGLALAATARGGGGPENVFLLVNSESQDSLTVANHYIALRDIPETNVLYLPYKGPTDAMSSEAFRIQILKPTFKAIQSRGLVGQIDYLVYSCDFPWRVGFRADFPNVKFPPQQSPFGSLTGMTYLHLFVSEVRKEIISLNTNWYYTDSVSGLTISRAFRSQYHWATGGRRVGTQGLSYMISSILGVTDGRSSKVPEVLQSLRTARKADGTKPKGTIYFMKHNGPRSKPRHNRFAAAASELGRLGVTAQVSNGKLPTNKLQIAGLTCGVGVESIGQGRLGFVPGAFCDNLTSFGGTYTIPKNLFNPKTGKKREFQLNTSDFIRYGATAACGTVVEPYNIPQKFPSPSVHVHYASGCSLGESFYQSVSGPYQQLLVGDPLCQPWAEIPKVELGESSKKRVLKGEVKFTPAVKSNDDATMKAFDLYVDGTRHGRCAPGQDLLLDTPTLSDGHHELRIVATSDTPIETQGREIWDVIVKNKRDAIALTSSQTNIPAGTEFLTLQVTSTQQQPVRVLHNSRELGVVESGTGTLRIEAPKLGSGPVELVAESDALRSQPLLLEIAR